MVIRLIPLRPSVHALSRDTLVQEPIGEQAPPGCETGSDERGTAAPGQKARAGDAANTACFDITVRADCHGTEFACKDCQWFHFGVHGDFAEHERLRFQILGLSRFKTTSADVKRGRFLTDGIRPVVRRGEELYIYIYIYIYV